MMFKQTVFVALLVVLAVDAKNPCCGPKQIMAGIGASVGQVDPDTGPQGLFIYQYGAFDYTKRMYGYNMTITYPNATSTTIRMIQNFAKGEQYIILDKFQYCLKQDVTYPELTNCIPDNATWTSSLFIGGIKGLYEDSWTYTYVHPKDPIEGVQVINVFQDTCYPSSAIFIGNRFQGKIGVPMISSGGVLNMTLGIPNPNEWFTVPSFCPTQMSASEEREARSAPLLPDLNYFHLPKFY